MYATITKTSQLGKMTTLAAVAPLVALPIIAFALFVHSPPWQLTWMLALSIYAGLKWLTIASFPPARQASTARVLGYLLLWPGMNAKAFLEAGSHAARPNIGEWLLASFNLGLGLALLFAVSPHLAGPYPLVAGWAGMVGMIFVLHFGFFHALSLCWRLGGLNAEPIMNFPILASSLSDFWGRRWNLAFRDLAFGYIFRPLVGVIGVAGATMAVFVVSGVIHDLVISVRARGGWGGPTLYFTMQGVGLLLERSHLGKRLGLGKGLTGRWFCGLFAAGPGGLLFHEPFVRHVILPTLAALGAI